jgi:hypothetical protein
MIYSIRSQVGGAAGLVPVFAGENGMSGQGEDTVLIRTGCYCF